MKKHIIQLLIICSVYGCSNSKEKAAVTPSESDSLSEHVSFVLTAPPPIGEYEGCTFYEGGFSGLYYIPGTTHEFYLINDRGPNLVIKDTLTHNKNIKLFPFPNYTQKLVKVLAKDGQLIIQNIIPLKAKNWSISGITLPVLLQNDQQEIAWKNNNGEIIPANEWGLDAEGIVFENDSVFWIADEYRPSLWKFNLRDSSVSSIISPAKGFNTPFKLPEVVMYRDANKGFESIALTPSKKIATMLQSPIQHFEPEILTKTRLSRLLLFNPSNGTSEQYVYEMNDSVPGKKTDWKIGDMVAVNEHQFLIMEHTRIDGLLSAQVYLVDIRSAGLIPEKKSKTFLRIEDAYDAKTLSEKFNLRPVSKHLILNLTEAGYPEKIKKPEGLTIIDEQTIAIVNDNDYGIESEQNPPDNTQSRIVFFKLNQKLDLVR